MSSYQLDADILRNPCVKRKSGESISQQELKEILRYDSESGLFYWTGGAYRNAHKDKPAGTMSGHEYIRIEINKRRYMAHRLAWLYVYGFFPDCIVDHINRIKTDNRIANLRMATKSENQHNGDRRADNTSGVKGVSWNKGKQKWRAHIGINKIKVHIGEFDTLEEAAKARKDAEIANGIFYA